MKRETKWFITAILCGIKYIPSNNDSHTKLVSRLEKMLENDTIHIEE